MAFSELEAAVDDLNQAARDLTNFARSSYTPYAVTFTPTPITTTSAAPAEVEIVGAVNINDAVNSFDTVLSAMGSELANIDFTSIDSVDTSGMPSDFTGEAPDFDTSGAPTSSIPSKDIIGAEPDPISYGVEPAEPEVTYIDGMPTLAPSAILPSPPNIDAIMPTFNAQLPEPLQEMLPPDPYNNAITNFDLEAAKDPYTSYLWELIQTRVGNDLLNGRLGIPVVVETEIWQRQLERNEIALDNAFRRISEEFSMAGFGLPPGRRDAKLKELVINATNVRTDTSRDVATKQADLTQEWQKIAIQYGVTMEQAQMDYMTKFAELAFTVARESVQAAINIYNAYVQQFNVQLEIYKTEASVYEAELRAVMTHVEIYKGQLDAAKIQNMIRKDDVELYIAKLQAAEIEYKIYATQMDTYIQKMNLQKLAYELYSEKVKTYEAMVRAYAAEWEGYKSKLEGEKGKQSAFISEVEAYKASVDSYQAKISAESAKVQAQGTENQAKIEQYRAVLSQITAYTSKLQAEVSAYSASIDADVRRTALEYDLQKTNTELEISSQRLAIEAGKASSDVTIASRKMWSESLAAQEQIDLAALSAASHTYAAITQAYLNGKVDITTFKGTTA